MGSAASIRDAAHDSLHEIADHVRQHITATHIAEHVAQFNPQYAELVKSVGGEQLAALMHEAPDNIAKKLVALGITDEAHVQELTAAVKKLVSDATRVAANKVEEYAASVDPKYAALFKGVTGVDFDGLVDSHAIANRLRAMGMHDERDIKELALRIFTDRLPPFPKSGVSLELLRRCKALAVTHRWTTTDLSEQFIKAETQAMQCSFEEFMRHKHSEEPHPTLGLTHGECFYDAATVFISHAWRYQFAELVDAVETFTEDHAPAEFSYWVDLFVNDQWNAPKLPYEWWAGTFCSAIGEIGRTVLVLSPWDAPVPLTRAWCLWEIHSTLKTKAALNVQLSAAQREAFIQTLRDDYAHIMLAFSKIDVRNSDAWNASDKQMIFAAVEAEEGGFDAVNNLIMGQLRDWLAATARKLLASDAAADGGAAPTVAELDDAVSAADLLSDQGKISEAMPLYAKAVQGYTALLGDEDPRTVNAINNMAILHTEQGQFAEAKGLFEQSLDVKERTLGFNHAATLDTANNLASVLMELDDLLGAQILFDKVLTAYTELQGADSPAVASVLNNVGNLLAREGDYDGATAKYEAALACQEKALGPDHPDTLSTVNNVANVLNQTGKIAASRALYQRAYAGYCKTLGDDHPDTVNVCFNLALVLKVTGSSAEAEKLFQKAHAGFEALYGPDHDDTQAAAKHMMELARTKKP